MPQPDVGKLMPQREHLRGFGIRAIDENERSKVIRHGEASELTWIEMAIVIVVNHPVAHDEEAKITEITEFTLGGEAKAKQKGLAQAA